jgi:excinuclease UvrABC ATPase subunit
LDLGNSFIIIKHNLDVIKLADHIIDIGPEGGKHGGKIIAKGTPEEIVKNKKSLIGEFLRREILYEKYCFDEPTQPIFIFLCIFNILNSRM